MSTSEETRSRSRFSPGPNATNGTRLRVWPLSETDSMLPWSAVITIVILAASAYLTSAVRNLSYARSTAHARA